MKRLAASFLLAAAAFTTAAADAHGQAARAGWQVSGTVGWYHPTQYLGTLHRDGEAISVKAEPSLLTGIGVERLLPGTAIGLRGQLLFAPFSGSVAQRPAGTVSCGTNCVRVVHTEEPLASGTVLIGVADAVIRAPRVLGIRPHFAVGAGLRRYGFDRADVEGDLTGALGEPTRFLAHVGAGAAARVGRFELTAEASDFLGRYRISDPSEEAGERMQHDVAITFGVALTPR